MDALSESVPVGLGQIDANGTLIGLNDEFARLFGIRVEDALHQPVHELPPPLDQCWREIVDSIKEADGLCRVNIVVGAPPDRRSLEVVGWAAMAADDRPAVQVLVSETPSVDGSQSLSGLVERARLAREIHDGLAQDLWLAKLTASKLARHLSSDPEGLVLCEELLRSIDAGLAEARTAVMAMRPDIDSALTLSELVERQAEEFSDRFGIRVDCHVEKGQSVPSRVSIEVLRVLQEALNNVRKHAHARRIVVRLEHRRTSLVLSVRDDGVGFDPAEVERGYGRQSMHERAQSIGARLRIASTRGRGTTVSLHVPLGQLVTHR